MSFIFARLLVLAFPVGAMWPGSSQAANTIPLSGTAGIVCTLNTTTLPAASALAITSATPAAQTINVGSVLQTCNDAAGFYVTVTSNNCATGAAGAKLIEPGSGTQVHYSVTSRNPDATTASLLLDASCTNQRSWDVTTTETSQTSQIDVVFNQSLSLFPGTYADTLTFTMTTK